MSDAPHRTRSKTRMSTIALWSIGAPIGLIGAFGWAFSSRVFLLDLMVSHQMLIAWGVVIFGVLAFLIRRVRLGVFLVLCALLAFVPVVTGRVVHLPEIDIANKPANVVRVVSCNINPKNENWRTDLDELLELDADVIVVIEIPPDMNRQIRKYKYLDNSMYPFWAHRAWVDQETSPGFILSKQPIRGLSFEADSVRNQHALHAHVQTPAGDFIAVLMHPLSPRDNRRWRVGNGIVEMQLDTIEESHTSSGLPVLVCADLNSAPAQHRSRLMRQSGVRQSKPLSRMGGSFPSNRSIPGMLMIQLDDVWTLGNASPLAWSSIDVSGSDHKAIVADFILKQD